MAKEKSPEFQEESFDKEDIESIEEVIPFDAEDEEFVYSAPLSDIDEEESVFFMGPESSEIDISSIVEEQNQEEEKLYGDTLSLRIDEKKGHHTHEGGEKKPHLQFGRFFTGLILVFVGLVFLGQNIGWFNVAHIDLLLLWPIVIIFLGLSILTVRKRWSKTFGFSVVLTTAFLLVAAFASGNDIVGMNLAGEIIEEKREVVSFSKISLQGVGVLSVEKGDTESLVVRADSAVLSKIETSVSDGALTLRFINPLFQLLFWDNVEIEYLITVKDIEAIAILGAGSVQSQRLTTDSLEVSITGSGEMELDIDVREFVARISGSGKYTVTGTADRQIIHIDGSGKYLGKDVMSKETGVRISGSGEAQVYVEEELDIEIQGSGKVRYRGEASISNSSISGSGSIERFDTGVPDVLKDSSILDGLNKRIDKIKDEGV